MIRDVNNVIRRIHIDETVGRTGIEEVVGIGTGVFIANMHAFDITPEPWFDYLYDSPRKLQAVQTEDFYFQAALGAAGGKTWCDWDNRSGHCKIEVVGWPEKAGVA